MEWDLKFYIFNNLSNGSDAASLMVTLLSSKVLEKIEKAVHVKTLIRLKQSGGPHKPQHVTLARL